MKQTVKRILLVCFGMIILCAALAACSGETTKGGDSGKTTSSQTADSSKPDNSQSDIDLSDDNQSETVPLSDIHVIDHAHYTYNDYDITDTFGNTYYGFHEFSSGSSHAIFNLDGEYDELTGSVVLDERSGSDYDYCIKIYSDDELIYDKDGIKNTTGKIDLDLDVSGCSQLKIEVEDVGNTGFYGLAIVNAELEK